jgi:hypothetical protein
MSKDITPRPATLDDAGAIADLLNACSIEQTGEPRTTGRRLATGMHVERRYDHYEKELRRGED